MGVHKGGPPTSPHPGKSIHLTGHNCHPPKPGLDIVFATPSQVQPLQAAAPQGRGLGVSWHPATCQLWGPPRPAHMWAGHMAHLWVPPDVSSLAYTEGLESTAATDPDTHRGGQSYTHCGLPIAATKDYRQKTRRDHISAVDTGHRPMPHSLTQHSVLTTIWVLGVVAPGTCRQWEGTGLTQAIWALSTIPAGVQGWEHRALASGCQADPILLSPQFQPLLPKSRTPPLGAGPKAEKRERPGRVRQSRKAGSCVHPRVGAHHQRNGEEGEHQAQGPHGAAVSGNQRGNLPAGC